MFFRSARASLCLIAILFGLPASAAEVFRVATYNVENYLDQPSGTRPAKSAEGRAKVCESIVALKPDILALQEIGETNTLLELQSSLKTKGVDLPYWEYITGFDTNIHVAVMSRFPMVARHPLTNDFFLLNGSPYRVSRGFAQVDLQINPGTVVTLIAAHLKSKRPIPQVSEADLRLAEAKVLREKIDAVLMANPDANLIVLGDFNDTHDSLAIRTLMGRGKKGLVDTRPGERNGDSSSAQHGRTMRNITWTDFYAKQDTYDRIDYIMLSRSLVRWWNPAETYVLAMPDWGVASDHRPLVAAFTIPDQRPVSAGK